ncbi:MAG: DUF115 domain-containing protein [Aliarcobacter skirrowii]|uniref:6-hydroxymethylpterin diphosphokinase MptE-like protein n=1 Tax=Aliarcobacter skirrowii TaxID=28200 RepID=UPI0024320569|nr:6-hydroxymethylpterin diphosphokinase MptE-like protein [Aliarcobacter skirrowii]MDD2509173.1 DUF115 domain-containing protein [Aliarcobacter skirrowii]MDD3496544.1 DUF115 domain-containing protein [Aliarcobacter skirrowii]
MTQAQIQLQNALTTTFLANMVFLNEYDNELYQRVENLSRMIETGEYQERYELEFVMENGDFDVFDKVTNSYLYDKNPKKINNNIINSIDFKKTKTISSIEGFFLYKENPTISLDFEFKGEFASLIQNNMQEYSNTLNDFLDNSTKTYKEINKLIFFSTLLGRHFPKAIQKINPALILIMEQNLEIFRLSLFTIDYSIFAKRVKVIFSIMDDTIVYEKKILDFLNTGIFDNYVIKFVDTKNVIVKSYYESFTAILTGLKASRYDFSRYLYTFINRTTNYIQEEYKFLLFNKIKNGFNVFKSLPVLYLAAGPSLDENITWVYENQDKFFIVTIGSVYKKLINKGIKVDLVATLDEQKWLERVQFPDEIIEKSSSNTIFLASSITNQKLLTKLKDRNLFIFEMYETFFKDNYSFTGNSIGEVTLDILLQLNAKNIYILGLDLALNQDTGETHSNEAESGKITINTKKDDEIKYGEKHKIITVRGNLQDSVNTITLFFGSIKDLENKLSKKDRDVNIYNLSTHGAYFEGSMPTKIESINLNEFKNIDKTLINLEKELLKFSQIGLNKELKDEYKNNIYTLEVKLKEILEGIKNRDFQSYIDFRTEAFLILELLQNSDKFLFLIFLNYNKIIIPYLNNHFNDTKLNQEYKKVQKIKKIFVNQLEVLLDDYILCLKRVL